MAFNKHLKKTEKNKIMIFILFLAFCLIIMIGFYFYITPKKTLNDAEKIADFLTNYRFRYLLPYLNITNYTLNLSSSCVIKLYAKYVSQSQKFFGMGELNFSILNRSLPIFEYVRIDLVPENYIDEYKKEFQQKHYACFPVPSLFNSSKVNSFRYKGAYVFCFYNFTDEGLRSMSIFYKGEKPNLYFCFANTMYKNTRISYGEWGFVESQNLTAFLNSANATIEEFISSYSN